LPGIDTPAPACQYAIRMQTGGHARWSDCRCRDCDHRKINSVSPQRPKSSLRAEGLGNGAHQLKTYKRMEGGSGGGEGQLGGSKQLSADDEEVQKAAEGALQQLSSRSNSLYPYKLKKVNFLCRTRCFQFINNSVTNRLE